MTDNDIIKALELCGNCVCNDMKTETECPLITMPFCKNYLRKQSLDLITRQKAEIESLTLSLEVTRDNLGDTRAELNAAETEIDRLLKQLDKTTETCTFVMKHNDEQNNKRFEEAIAVCKAEAIKETEERMSNQIAIAFNLGFKDGVERLAERLKEKSREPFGSYYGKIVRSKDIDTIASEMVGDV